MKIKLNVRINLTPGGRVFTIWPAKHCHLPGVEFHTGCGSTTREAVENLFLNLPDEFNLDDDICIQTTSLEYELKRPFEIVRSDSIRTFICS